MRAEIYIALSQRAARISPGTPASQPGRVGEGGGRGGRGGRSQESCDCPDSERSENALFRERKRAVSRTKPRCFAKHEKGVLTKRL